MLSSIEVENRVLSSDKTLNEIYLVGEEINCIIEKIFIDGITNGELKENLDVPKISFMFWVSLSSYIVVANNKKDYINKSLMISKDEFLDFCFSNLLKAVLK